MIPFGASISGGFCDMVVSHDLAAASWKKVRFTFMLRIRVDEGVRCSCIDGKSQRLAFMNGILELIARLKEIQGSRV